MKASVIDKLRKGWVFDMRVRKVVLGLMSLVLLGLGIYLLPLIQVDAAEQIQVNIHYHRFSGDYDGWNIWSWLSGKEGARYEFNGEDEFGKVATFNMDVDAGTNEIGFIVRYSTESNDWEQKDTTDDRFMNISYAKDEVIDIYVVQGEASFGYGENEMNIGPKLLSASFVDTSTIEFSVTKAFDIADENIINKLTITDKEGKTYNIASVTSAQGTEVTEGVITTVESLPIGGNYILEFGDYGTMAISGNNLFTTKEFEDAFFYGGDDLGATWSKDKTAFRLWAPTATEVIINLFESGKGDKRIESIPMNKDVNGTWYLEKTGDLHGVYYTYSVTVGDSTKEAVDPYAKATGANGDRAMVVNLVSTNPEGFVNEKKPEFVNPTDAIIYELHIRDFSIDKNSGIKNKGKYLAFTEKATSTKSGVKTGLDHLVDLGITHLHLLPTFDYATVDETTLMNNDFNWGYDPENYNVPEGSYSTDPHHGEVRINEFKQMVASLHENGIRVVMDVVYNHTSASADSNLNKVVPGYYYRMTEDGQFSNASGCGNETASERAMVRKYIVDSVVYWATEYHIDGFRFDLMGIHDIETMNAVREALDKVDPSIIIYGEGWTAGGSPLPESERALKANMSSLDPRIAAFSDDIRDGIKGSVFTAEENGYVSGKEGMEETIKFGIVASTNHNQIDYSKINYSSFPWAKEPTQTITYASAHDNLTLWDKLASSNPSDSEEDRIKMNMLSSAIVLTSQGTPFIHAGEESLRSKPLDESATLFDHNSYKSPDSVNSLRWDRKGEYSEVYDYYKGLIEFRKDHSALRMTMTSDIQANLKFMDGLDPNVVAYTIENFPNGEQSEAILVIFNANKSETTVNIPEGNWNVYVDGNKAGTKVLKSIDGGKATVEPISAMVLVKEDKPAEDIIDDSVQDSTDTISSQEVDSDSSKGIIKVFAILGVVILCAVGAFFAIKKNKKK